MNRPGDTSAEAHAAQLGASRRLGPERRLELGLELAESGRDLARAGIRARHSDYSDADVEDALFADRPLHTLSHGEAFLATIHNRARGGLILLDEPESALSPQRQLSLLALLARAVRAGDTQVIMATHSPIMMTFPEAQLLSFDEGRVRPTTLEQTSHYEITRGVLASPERYWQHLLD